MNLSLPLSIDDEEKFIEAIHAKKVSLMLFAKVEGKIGGSFTLLRSDRPRLFHFAELGVSVSQIYWGQGIGSKLCEAGVAWAKAQGVRKIELKVHEENAAAIRLYEKIGFVKEGLLSRTVRINNRFSGSFVMGLPIDDAI